MKDASHLLTARSTSGQTITHSSVGYIHRFSSHVLWSKLKIIHVISWLSASLLFWNNGPSQQVVLWQYAFRKQKKKSEHFIDAVKTIYVYQLKGLSVLWYTFMKKVVEQPKSLAPHGVRQIFTYIWITSITLNTTCELRLGPEHEQIRKTSKLQSGLFSIILHPGFSYWYCEVCCWNLG